MSGNVGEWQANALVDTLMAILMSEGQLGKETAGEDEWIGRWGRSLAEVGK